MQPKSGSKDQGDLFRSRLDQILNRHHPLFRLADSIDWSLFEKEFGPLYVENLGRPGLPIRLLVGLHYLKHASNLSDEAAVERFLENPYWQYFCGFEFFQHEFPLDPTTLVKWRKRIGPKGMEKLLQVTVETAKSKEYLTEKHLERVNVDTTVQESNRHHGGMRLQHQEAPKSYPFVAFQRAVQGRLYRPDNPDREVQPAVSTSLKQISDFFRDDYCILLNSDCRNCQTLKAVRFYLIIIRSEINWRKCL